MPPQIAFEKYTLSNGLDVILHEDHALPVAAVNIWYHVGSQNEEPDRTGFAHLFEHIMFKGSKHHPHEYFMPLQELGANVNGSTTVDRTNYYENLPAEYLELALWLESDRMGFLLDALDEQGFTVEREVVKNERRQSYENRPYGLASLEIRKALFPPNHPYHWPTIGSQEHLDAASIEDVKAFFRRFYLPNNASLAVAGDIDPHEAKRQIERYFGDLPPGPAVPRIQRWTPQVDGEVRLRMDDRVQLHRLYWSWPAPPRFDADEAPLDVLMSILGEGHSSRLYRSLVYEKQLARSVGAGYDASEIAGEIRLDATVAPGVPVEDAEQALLAEVERLRAGAPEAHEIQRALNRLEAQHVRQLESVGGFRGRANLLNYFNVFSGDPGSLNSDFERYQRVSAQDVQRVAQQYLSRGRVRLLISPAAQVAPARVDVDRSHAPGHAQARSFDPPVPRRLRVTGDIDVLVIEKHDVPAVATGVYFPGGALRDPMDRAGLASLTFRLLTEGTATRSSTQIADESEFIAARLNVSPHREYVLGSSDVLTHHWPAALDLLADVLTSPAFEEQEVERIRRERLTDLRRLRDDPNAIADRVTAAVLYGVDSAYGHPGLGREASISAIRRQELISHHDAGMRHNRPTVVIAGDIEAEAAASEVERILLARWAAGEHPQLVPAEPLPESTREATIYLVDKPGAAQSVIAAGHLTVPRLHADYVPLQIMNMAFGGQFTARLNMNLREAKGYTYGYRSRFDWRLTRSSFIAGGSVHTAVTKDAVAETLKEFRDLHGERPLSVEEFDKARQALIRGYPPGFETAGQLLGRMLDLVHFGLPDGYFSGHLERLAAVSLADVHRVAQEHIRPDNLAVVIVGDAEKVEAELSELGLPLLRLDDEGLPLS